jgi:hypothetical protein
LTTNINYNEVIIIASLNEMAERCTEWFMRAESKEIKEKGK